MVRSAALVAALLLAACSEEVRAPGEAADDPGLGRVLEEGTPDALGVAAMLNDPSTTVAVLDVDAALDARAAKNLVAHRDGKDGRFGTADDDPFGSVAEIDAVSYVGDAALAALVAFARAEGWVAADDDLYGVVEGVELTVDDAAAVVWAANTGTYAELDAFLDARAASALVANRPFTTAEQVAAQSYVGKTALEALVDYGLANGPGGGALPAADALALLDARVDGLWFLSESDSPLVPFSLATPGPIAAADAKAVFGPRVPERPGEVGLEGRFVEETDLAWFFDRTTVEQDWWDDDTRAQAAKWRAVREVFERDLTGAQVFRIGRRSGSTSDLVGAIDVFVVGTSADGQTVGIQTVSVET